MTKLVKTTSRSSKKTKKSAGKASVVAVKSKKAFSNYSAAFKYLIERTDYEKGHLPRYNNTNFNLDRMKKLLSMVGNPHLKIPTIHIAGTKGKGSTATMLGKMLEYNDYKVGLYTSPHVISIHERIAVNSEMISESEMLGLINRLYTPVEKISQNDRVSFFEFMTAMAFMHFVDVKADISVIETGLGGRLDSTNLIKPELIGITSLSIDHQMQLGNNIESIAKEKAGIFKKGTPVITVQQSPEALQVLKTVAAEVGSPLSVTGRDIPFSYRFETSREEGPHTRICLTTPTSKFEHLRVPLHGTHQAINCGLALAMLDKLKSMGYQIDNDKAVTGLQNVTLSGRMEMICSDPRVMIDAAHNAASIKEVIHAIGQNIPYDSMIVIFGCNSDKDIKGMLTELQYGADKVIFTRSNSTRAVSPFDLSDMYSQISTKMCQSAPSLGEALKIAQSAVGKEDLILITGSFYLIGQAKTRLQPLKTAQTV